jgi:hypothetical protein
VKRSLYALLFVLLIYLSAWPALLAQGVLAEVHGIVTDSTGLALQNATITVTDTAKGWSRVLHSNDQGEYELPQLEPDTISIAVEAPNFKRIVRKGIVLQTGQQAQVDFKLQTGDVDQTVTVTADASQVQADNGTLGTVVDERKIKELPLNGRNFFQLAQLVPNAFPPIPNSSLSFRGGFNIAGQPEVNNNYILDGIDNSDEATMQPTVSPSVDGIQEFKVLTGAYTAEYGRYSGGQILITTKSGSNSIRGTAYEFYRTSALDAKNYFSPGALPSFNRNQYGVTMGAPIVRNHAFVFGTYEGLRLTQQISALATVPTAQERTGNLSDLVTSSGKPVAVLNPATGIPFPGNQLPAIDPVSQGLLAYYPLPNLPGVASNYLFSETRTQRQDQFSLRVDDNLTKSNSFFVSYQYQNSNAFEPSNSLCGSSVLPGFGCTTPELDQALSIHDTQIISPAIVNELRVGYNRIRTNRFLQDAQDGDVLDALGIPTNTPNGVGLQSGDNLGVPSVTVSGYATLGGATNLPQGRRDNTLNYIDVLSWTKGTHNMRFGADIKRFVYNLTYYQNGRGVFAFNGQYTTNALADFLLGDLLSTSRAPGDPGVHSFTTTSDFFAEDEWHATPNLTLSYGLRYELDFPEGERQNRISTFDPLTGLVPVADGQLLTVQNGALVNVGTSSLIGQVWRLDKTNFAPRIGISYQPFGDQKTILRAGYGIFYDQVVAGNGISQMWRGIPFRDRQTFTNVNSSTYPKPTLSATWTAPFPSGPTAAGGFTPNGINSDYRTANYQQWSLSVDRELQKDLSLELSYLGTKGTHLQESYNLNQPTPGPGAIQGRRPYPQWGSITWVDSNGYSNFNSLGVQLQRRYAQGMTLLIAYTYSHSLDDAPYSGTLQNPQNLPSQYASSDFDVHHRLVSSFTYELPVGRGRALGNGFNRLVEGAISDWQVNGIFVFQTGIPFTVTTTKDISNTGASNYAQVVPGVTPTVSSPTPARWFNTAAFADDLLPAGSYAYGTASRNSLRSDGPVNLDLGVYRRIRFIRETQFELRAEVYNTLNHPTFSAPTANVESPSFGQVTSTSNSARQTQFAVKYIF